MLSDFVYGPMRRAATLQLIFAALLLNILPFAGAHGHDEHGAMDMGSATASTVAAMPSSTQRSWDAPMSYFVYSDHSGWMIAHISLMVLAWFFILPIGTRPVHVSSTPTNCYEVLCSASPDPT